MLKLRNGLPFPFLPFSLVFSQSLISLDLIEDFLELASRDPEEGKPVIYKGKYRNVEQEDASYLIGLVI